jgi:hypothetical protein
MAEPQGRGTFTTRQLPRGTISALPKASRQLWNKTRWAAPDYTQGRYDKTAQTTKMLPRRTVSLLAPDIFARPTGGPARNPGRGLVATGSTLDGASVGCGSTLDGTSIGGESTLGKHAYPKSGVDPIVDYGKKGANIIIGAVMKLPHASRKVELQKVLDKIGHGFRSSVEDKAKTFQEAGHKPKEALHMAVSAALSNKFLSDAMHAGSSFASDLGDLWDDIGNKLADVHCAVASSGITKTAATVAGGVYGGPAGAAAAGAGANVLAAPCGGGSKAPRAPLPGAAPVQPSSFPTIPVVAAAGGALILFLALK